MNMKKYHQMGVLGGGGAGRGGCGGSAAAVERGRVRWVVGGGGASGGGCGGVEIEMKGDSDRDLKIFIKFEKIYMNSKSAHEI